MALRSLLLRRVSLRWSGASCGARVARARAASAAQLERARCRARVDFARSASMRERGDADSALARDAACRGRWRASRWRRNRGRRLVRALCARPAASAASARLLAFGAGALVCGLAADWLRAAIGAGSSEPWASPSCGARLANPRRRTARGTSGREAGNSCGRGAGDHATRPVPRRLLGVDPSDKPSSFALPTYGNERTWDRTVRRDVDSESRLRHDPGTHPGTPPSAAPGQMTAVMRAVAATGPKVLRIGLVQGGTRDRRAHHQAAHPRHRRPERKEHVRGPRAERAADLPALRARRQRLSPELPRRHDRARRAADRHLRSRRRCAVRRSARRRAPIKCASPKTRAARSSSATPRSSSSSSRRRRCSRSRSFRSRCYAVRSGIDWNTTIIAAFSFLFHFLALGVDLLGLARSGDRRRSERRKPHRFAEVTSRSASSRRKGGSARRNDP